MIFLKFYFLQFICSWKQTSTTLSLTVTLSEVEGCKFFSF